MLPSAFGTVRPPWELRAASVVVTPVMLVTFVARSVGVPTRDAAVRVESPDELEEDGVGVSIVDWGEIVQDEFLCGQGEKPELVDGFLR